MAEKVTAQNADNFSFTYQDSISSEEWNKKFADQRRLVLPLSQLGDEEIDALEEAGYVVGVSGDYASKPGYAEYIDERRLIGRDVNKKNARRRHFNWMRRNGLYILQLRLGLNAIASGRRG
jgi:hypothetical protein